MNTTPEVELNLKPVCMDVAVQRQREMEKSREEICQMLEDLQAKPLADHLRNNVIFSSADIFYTGGPFKINLVGADQEQIAGMFDLVMSGIKIQFPELGQFLSKNLSRQGTTVTYSGGQLKITI